MPEHTSRPPSRLAGDDGDAPSIDAGALARWVTVEEACETLDTVTAESIKQDTCRYTTTTICRNYRASAS